MTIRGFGWNLQALLLQQRDVLRHFPFRLVQAILNVGSLVASMTSE